MTLLAFAAERRAAAVPGSRHCPPARRAHSSNPLHAAAAVNIGDRQTDRWADGHHTVTQTLLHTVQAVSLTTWPRNT